MIVTITGSAGFVGQNVLKYLKSSFNTEILSIRYFPNQNIDFETDAVIHLSGKAHDLKNVTKPQDYYDANFELTKQLFDGFIRSNASVFIFMSTVKAAADSVDGILNEETNPSPKTHYGIAKLEAERYILSQSLPDNKRVYILRPCMIHGPGNKGNLNLLYKLVKKGVPWPLGAFSNRRSFLSIQNLCFVIEELLQNNSIPQGVYNVADDEPLATNKVIELIGESLKKNPSIWKINTSFVKFCSKVGDLTFLPLNSERLQKLTENYEVSNSKLITALGKPLPVQSEAGILLTFQSFAK
ncbi:NAD-dependent epimerase/dehydratase family protein [Flavobacterium frigidarium]|uniref:NAD-dependent epimerase/dehydratase family protein n=1 Tax=Flavobacterium frigidarium TaxID=99286 RepID=UPI00040A4037|nr:NAD-dependent epimerase/dehydratase family protein [Flavobacterium frigidarium]